MLAGHALLRLSCSKRSCSSIATNSDLVPTSLLSLLIQSFDLRDFELTDSKSVPFHIHTGDTAECSGSAFRRTSLLAALKGSKRCAAAEVRDRRDRSVAVLLVSTRELLAVEQA